MSNFSSSKENNIVISHSSSKKEKNKKYFYCSEQKPKPSKLIDDDAENDLIPNMLLNYGYNSCSISGNNKLFESLINSKKIKNKELSLLYLINTFNKSYSSESAEKNNVIVDLPKISKKLFSNSHLRHKSSTALDIQSFQKNLYIPKCSGEIVNNFFSNIYSSGGEMPNYTISPKKCRKNNRFMFNSGNKGSSDGVSPFSGNYKYAKLFSNNNINCNCLNKGFNLNVKEQKEDNIIFNQNQIRCSSLLANIVLSSKSDGKE